MESQRAAHPIIVEVIHNMSVALKGLETAPDVVGGNKAVAIAYTRWAIHSLKRALYFHLNMDEAAIDRAESCTGATPGGMAFRGKPRGRCCRCRVCRVGHRI